MTISDEKLSSFLNGSLPEDEMATIRTLLNSDEGLMKRLEQMSQTDEILIKAYSKIDDLPLPSDLQARIDASLHYTNKSSRSKLSLIDQLHLFLKQHAVAATSLALVAGIGVTQVLTTEGVSNVPFGQTEIASVLEASVSGQPYELTDGTTLAPRLTFTNVDGNYCRQFNLASDTTASQNIACRNENEWQLVATFYSGTGIGEAPYQTASGGTALDFIIDGIISGGPLSKDEESIAIGSKWNKSIQQQ